jgi:hypothetical protein
MPDARAQSGAASKERTTMTARNTPVCTATGTLTRRSMLLAMLLGATACAGTNRNATLEDPQLRSASGPVLAQVASTGTRDIKPPGDDTDEPPGELPDVVVDTIDDDDD